MRPDWMDDAPCKGHGELFFTRSPGPGADRAEAAALAMCAACPHQVPCREMGRQTRSHGTWGGETEVQRTRAGFGPALPDTKASQRAHHEYLAERGVDRGQHRRHSRKKIPVPDVPAAYLRRADKEQIAASYGVSVKTLYRWIAQLEAAERRTG